MANPRIDELRKRLDREPGSRLFGQLAEELRKDGELIEAIRVARIGLAAHPNYPSARMTLGRALFDTGDLAAARAELELVLRGAPENILASRMLAECLEGLGDHGAALLQFRAALRLAPGDRQTELQIRSLEQRLAGAGVGRPAPPPIPGAASAPPVAAPVSPRPQPTAPAPTPAPPPPPPVAPVRPAAPPLPPAAPAPSPAAAHSASPVAAPTPAAETAADFDDVFETAPSWQRAASAAAAPEGEALLLLEDEAPTLPGSSHVAPRPGVGSPSVEHRPIAPPAPLASPSPEPPRPVAPPPPTQVVSAPPEPLRVTPPPLPVASVFPLPPRDVLDFGAPPSVSPQAPLTIAFESAPTADALAPEAPRPPTVGADTVAGAPAFVPPASVFPASPLPQEPAMTMLPDEPIPTAAVGESTAAFAALSATIPPPPPPGTPAPPTLVDELDTVEPMAVEVAPSPESPALSTPTLAELYFDQGFTDKAIQVYEEILEREPHNERARARLIEIKALSRHVAEAAPADPRAERRLTLERKIARLEQMLAAVRRG